jgi:hypothetical protein
MTQPVNNIVGVAACKGMGCCCVKFTMHTADTGSSLDVSMSINHPSRDVRYTRCMAMK